VVQAFVLAVEGGKGVYNIADSEPLPFVRFAEMLMKDLGRKPRKMPPFLVGIMARAVGMKTYLNVLTANRHYDISAAKAGLKFSPKADLEKSTKEMVDWYLANKSK
jgi:nucleoside-diphosphate-sugar epimerase